MSRIISVLVLTTLVLLPNPGVATSSPDAPDEMEVQIQFSGLMVFHFNKDTQSYEVGVLSEADSHGHDFCIQRKGAAPLCRAALPKGTRWTLSVTSSNLPGASLVKKGHTGRRPDDDAGQYDFDWIVDLEGPEFHNKPLTLQPGHLIPIIQLPKAALFTAYKSEDFVRWQGKKPADPSVFGFLSETTGMTLRLKSGEKVVLSQDGVNGGTSEEILSIPYTPPTPVGRSDELLIIANVRPNNPINPDPSSDFGMYYRLFKGVSTNEQFDFDLNPDKKRLRAKNPLPGYKTCCQLRCTSIFLSKLDKPLQ